VKTHNKRVVSCQICT